MRIIFLSILLVSCGDEQIINQICEKDNLEIDGSKIETINYCVANAVNINIVFSYMLVPADWLRYNITIVLDRQTNKVKELNTGSVDALGDAVKSSSFSTNLSCSGPITVEENNVSVCIVCLIGYPGVERKIPITLSTNVYCGGLSAN